MSVYITAIYENDNIDVQTPIGINNAGYIKIDTIDTYTDRPDGRSDYYLVYIKSGVGYFKIDGMVYTLSENNIILYHPHEPQNYSYYACDQPEIYWIHFGGTQIRELLTHLGLIDKRIIEIQCISDVINTTNSLIKELRAKEDFYDMICASKLINLLSKIARNIISKDTIPEHSSINEIINYITDNYATNETIEDYASICHMSESSFFKLFKQSTGMSPQHYKAILRIKTAMSMLSTSNFPISQIAHLVGYNDSLYFSKLFKKHTGMTPTQYRNTVKTIDQNKTRNG